MFAENVGNFKMSDNFLISYLIYIILLHFGGNLFSLSYLIQIFLAWTSHLSFMVVIVRSVRVYHTRTHAQWLHRAKLGLWVCLVPRVSAVSQNEERTVVVCGASASSNVCEFAPYLSGSYGETSQSINTGSGECRFLWIVIFWTWALLTMKLHGLNREVWDPPGLKYIWVHYTECGS